MSTATYGWAYPALTVAADVTATVKPAMDAIDTTLAALVAALGGQVCTSTTRPTASTSTGKVIYESDTGFTRISNGTAWLMVSSGMVPIIPTSVAGTGVTVDAKGRVTFTAATALSLNGVFATAFDNYRVLMHVQSASVALGGSIRLRASGTDDANNYYSNQQTYTSGAAITTAATASVSSWAFSAVAGTEHQTIADLFAPALALPTLMRLNNSTFTGVTSNGTTDYAGRQSQAAAYDGLSIIASSGNMTGTLRVYGYNN
jgi:hypothetical protein